MNNEAWMSSIKLFPNENYQDEPQDTEFIRKIIKFIKEFKEFKGTWTNTLIPRE